MLVYDLIALTYSLLFFVYVTLEQTGWDIATVICKNIALFEAIRQRCGTVQVIDSFYVHTLTLYVRVNLRVL